MGITSSDAMRKKRVAVTGGRGFVGGRLVARLLASGAQVRVLTRDVPERSEPHLSFTYGDLTGDHGGLKHFLEGADIVYHCAGELHRQDRMRAVNVEGTRRLIEAARGRVGRWVQLSSVGAYGPVANGIVTEDSPEVPIGEYEQTKTEADRLVKEAAMEGAFSAVVLRPSIVYGPTMRNRSLLQLISAIDRGLFFFIGPPGAVANYVHVDNVVDALVLCGSNDRALGGQFIVSDHRSLEAFVASIASALGRSVPRLRLGKALAQFAARMGGRLPGFPLTPGRVNALTNRTIYSADLIRKVLGFEHRISMEEGVREMVSSLSRGAGDVRS